MRVTRAIVCLSTFLLAVMCGAAQVGAAAELAPLYTPPTGGTVYILGAGVAAVTNKYMPDANFVHESATGTMEMVRRMFPSTRGRRST